MWSRTVSKWEVIFDDGISKEINAQGPMYAVMHACKETKRSSPEVVAVYRVMPNLLRSE